MNIRRFFFLRDTVTGLFYNDLITVINTLSENPPKKVMGKRYLGDFSKAAVQFSLADARRFKSMVAFVWANSESSEIEEDLRDRKYLVDNGMEIVNGEVVIL